MGRKNGKEEADRQVDDLYLEIWRQTAFQQLETENEKCFLLFEWINSYSLFLACALIE